MKMKYNSKEFPFSIPDKLRRKLDVLIATLDEDDVWMLIDGDEGSGKTNMAAFLLYYFHCVTGRKFTVEQFFFDSEALLNFVRDTKEMLVNWDEAALGGLSTEWFTKSQINILKFAMTGRKKHHIFILCIPRQHRIGCEEKSI